MNTSHFTHKYTPIPRLYTPLRHTHGLFFYPLLHSPYQGDGQQDRPNSETNLKILNPCGISIFAVLFSQQLATGPNVMSTKEIHDPGDKETKPHPFDLTSLPSIEFLATIFLFTSPPDSLKPVPNLPYANVQLSLSQSLPYFLMPKPSFCQSIPNAKAFLLPKPS